MVVLGYASKALRPCERNMQNYSSMKLELLALYWAVRTQRYRDLLLGTEFIVFTDNNTMSYWQTTAKSRRAGLQSSLSLHSQSSMFLVGRCPMERNLQGHD